MRLTLALLIMVPLWAQQAPPAQEKKPEAQAPAAEAPAQTPPAEAQAPAAEAQPAPAAESPAPSAPVEQWFSGSIEAGNRWVTGPAGNFEAYRSVVNLGEGPRVTAVDFTFEDPKKRMFERIDGHAIGWGGDPYNTALLTARKMGAYDFRFDYRNIAYFNALPSFASPDTPFTQHAFDTRRRLTSFQLDLMPGRRIIPYLSYARNSGDGRGVTTFVAEGNEFAVPNLLRDRTDNYRAGVRFEFNRFHVTAEQGGTTFKDDQFVYESLRNSGNRPAPIGSQQLVLNDLSQAYGIRGDSIYSRVLVTARPVSWANLFGQFLFSQPKNDVRYSEEAIGNFVVLSSLLFYNARTLQATGEAKQPRTSGNLGAEIRLFDRLRIIESFTTDRLHNATLGVLAEQLLAAGTSGPPVTSILNDRLVWNYNQQQVDVLFDLSSRLTLRGGHRFVWGDSTVRAGQLSQTGNFDSGELRRQVGLAGVSFRPGQKLSVNADYEGASSSRAYFRVSLYDYHRARVRARYQVLPSLALQANLNILSNQNPLPGVQYDYLSRVSSVSFHWNPADGRRINLMGEYSRSTLRSDITYIAPQDFVRERSFYRDNAHSGSVLTDIVLPAYAGMSPRVSVGGSLFVSSGSRPTKFYQPLARLSLPIERRVYWVSEWRWYGFGEPFYQFEGFRTHTFMTGLRLTK
jgi:hypothetical protein